MGTWSGVYHHGRTSLERGICWYVMVNHDILHWYRVGYRYLGYLGISGDNPREPEIVWPDTEHNDNQRNGTEQGTGTEHRNWGTQTDRKTPFHHPQLLENFPNGLVMSDYQTIGGSYLFPQHWMLNTYPRWDRIGRQFLLRTHWVSSFFSKVFGLGNKHPRESGIFKFHPSKCDHWYFSLHLESSEDTSWVDDRKAWWNTVRNTSSLVDVNFSVTSYNWYLIGVGDTVSSGHYYRGKYFFTTRKSVRLFFHVKGLTWSRNHLSETEPVSSLVTTFTNNSYRLSTLVMSSGLYLLKPLVVMLPSTSVQPVLYLLLREKARFKEKTYIWSGVDSRSFHNVHTDFTESSHDVHHTLQTIHHQQNTVPPGLLLRTCVYYESINRDLKTRPIYECRCDERLKTNLRNLCLLWIDKDRTKDKTYIWVSARWKTKN